MVPYRYSDEALQMENKRHKTKEMPVKLREVRDMYTT